MTTTKTRLWTVDEYHRLTCSLTNTKLRLMVLDRKDLEDKGDKGDKEEKVLRTNATLYKLPSHQEINSLSDLNTAE